MLLLRLPREFISFPPTFTLGQLKTARWDTLTTNKLNINRWPIIGNWIILQFAAGRKPFLRCNCELWEYTIINVVKSLSIKTGEKNLIDRKCNIHCILWRKKNNESRSYSYTANLIIGCNCILAHNMLIELLNSAGETRVGIEKIINK